MMEVRRSLGVSRREGRTKDSGLAVGHAARKRFNRLTYWFRSHGHIDAGRCSLKSWVAVGGVLGPAQSLSSVVRHHAIGALRVATSRAPERDG